jgi:putative Ca2+/H+ antiporter (TMEM165/GDT1 family)
VVFSRSLFTGAMDADIALDMATVSSGSLAEAFSSTLMMILVSELGDKTFFIAALMAMRHDRRAVFAGAASALVLMTGLSVVMGVVLPSLLPKVYTHWAAVGLFVFFGGKLLKEAIEMLRKGEGAGPSDELEEVEHSLKEDGSAKGLRGLQAVIGQIFVMTFLAEWGDRSQISTIALAAAKDPVGVMIGGSLGHCFCTALAVLGGKYLATSISERVVVGIGGVLFLIFAVHGAIVGPS